MFRRINKDRKEDSARRRIECRRIERGRRLIAESLEDRKLLATLTVNSIGDGPVDLTDAVVTLRDAVHAANNDLQVSPGGPTGSGGDTINFAKGGTIRLTQGEIEITEAVTIDGSTARPVLITGDPLGDDTTDATGITDLSQTDPAELDDNTRIFSVTDVSATVTLDSLTLTGGRTTGNNANFVDSTYNGGGVRSLADLTITRSTISGNSTAGGRAYGGGISVEGGNATITSSKISDNSTAAPGAGLSVRNGDATVTSSTISGNSTTSNGANGGGLFVRDGNATLTSSTISGNSTAGYAAWGGGLYLVGGEVTLTNSALTGNTTTGFYAYGGGICVWDGNVTLTSSTVSGNSTAANGADGGGIYVGGLNGNGNATLTGSTVSDNSTAGYSASGGGLFVRGDATLTSSTISGNSTAGIYAHGGGLFVTGRGTTLINSTISGNSTAGNFARGGGLHVGSGATLTNSIVLGNATNFTEEGRDEISLVNGSFTFNGYNIVGADMAAFDTTAHSNAQNAAPSEVFATTTETLVDNDGDGTAETGIGVMGGVLADNGGTVQTIALKVAASNPALDTSDPAAALSLDESLLGVDLTGDGDTDDVLTQVSDLAFDARGPGFDRNIGAGIDLGAYEAAAINEAPTISTLISSNGNLDNKSDDGEVTIRGTFADVDPLDTHTVSVDWGDGSDVETLSSVNQTLDRFRGLHNYATGGLYTIVVTVTDAASEVAEAETTAVVTGVGLVDGVLYIIGTDGRDNVKLKHKATTDELKVDMKLNQGSIHRDRIKVTYTASSIDRIVAILCAGDDRYDGGSVGGNDRAAAISATVLGGAGDDDLRGSNAPDAIVGGDGKDKIEGRGGSDILIGGDGHDRLSGGDGEDILIGGYTDHDNDLNALDDVFKEWNSAADYTDRVAALRTGNGSTGVLLDASTVHDDGDKDKMDGEKELDWYLGNRTGSNMDKIKLRNGELFDQI